MSWKAWLILGVMTAGLLFLLSPMIIKAMDGEGYVRSQNSLQHIGLALLNYHDVFGKFPPAVVRDQGGKPLYSWRVPILQFLDTEPAYETFRLNEAWDSPHNRPLSEKTPPCFQPALGGPDGAGLTRYQVLIGPGTAFERDGLTLEDFPDGRANTILVGEGAEPVPWSKPAELLYDPARPLPAFGGPFRKAVHFLGYEVRRKPGFNALFADGTVRFIPSDTDERIIRALITRNGGEPVDLSKLE